LVTALIPALCVGICGCFASPEGESGNNGIAGFSTDLLGTDEDWPMVAEGSSFHISVDVVGGCWGRPFALTSTDPDIVEMTATHSQSDEGCYADVCGEATARKRGTTTIQLRCPSLFDDDSAGDDDDSAGDDDDSAGDDDDSANDADDAPDDDEPTYPDDVNQWEIIDSIDLIVGQPVSLSLLHGHPEDRERRWIHEPVALVAGTESTLYLRVKTSFGTEMGFDAVDVDWSEDGGQISRAVSEDVVTITAVEEGATDQLQLRFGDVERTLDVSTVCDVHRLAVLPERLEERHFIIYIAAVTEEGVPILDPPYRPIVRSGNPTLVAEPTLVMADTWDTFTPVVIDFKAGTAEAKLHLRSDAQTYGSWEAALSMARRQNQPSTCAMAPGTRPDSVPVVLGLFALICLFARRIRRA